MIYQLISRPGAASFGMALAASVVLGALTVGGDGGSSSGCALGSMGAF